MKDFLFSKPTDSNSFSLLLLAFRIFFGLMLMIHGFEKLYNYTQFGLFPSNYEHALYHILLNMK